jgi:hypothetical protein
MSPLVSQRTAHTIVTMTAKVPRRKPKCHRRLLPSSQGKGLGLYRATKQVVMLEQSKDKNLYEQRTYKEAKPLSHLGKCDVFTRGTKEYGGNAALPGNTEQHHA